MLSKGDLVFPVKVGETLDGAYRVESISETEVTLIYLPLKQKQNIVVSSWLPPVSESKASSQAAQVAGPAAPPTAPAQPQPPATAAGASAPPAAVPAAAAAPASGRATLSWRAPDTIRVGEDVKVELLVKTDGALRSLPLQVSFDPGALQFVEVQEGAFFRQGGGKTSFAHNVDQANGRLFVGITRSGAGGAKGEDGLITIVFRAKAQKPKSELRVLAATAVAVGPSAVTVGLPQPQLLSVVQ
jgi:general secretion pathway protein D